MINPTTRPTSDGNMGYHDPAPTSVHPRLYPPVLPSAARLAALDHAARNAQRWDVIARGLEMVADVAIVALVIYVMVLL
jgi:hypothetical protein